MVYLMYMSNKRNDEKPFTNLGDHLKALRERKQESLAEVSGAVEIDVQDLANFEMGQARPSEDILMLLISHFGAKDDEAVKLWELAGYGTNDATVFSMTNEQNSLSKTNAVVLPIDARIVYTDMVHVMVNPYGVVLNFLQGGGPNMQPLAVSRVGMSRDHAKSVLQVLQSTLEQSEKANNQNPKQLPPEKSDQND